RPRACVSTCEVRAREELQLVGTASPPRRDTAGIANLPAGGFNSRITHSAPARLLSSRWHRIRSSPTCERTPHSRYELAGTAHHPRRDAAVFANRAGGGEPRRGRSLTSCRHACLVNATCGVRKPCPLELAGTIRHPRRDTAAHANLTGPSDR